MRGWRESAGMRFAGEDGGASRDMWGLDPPGTESMEVPACGGLTGLDEREEEEAALVAPERNAVDRARLALGVR